VTAIQKPPDSQTSRILTLRVPVRLEQQLGALALRDANSLSATVRRLIALGIRAESLTEPEHRG
jgi:hypothetical protein